MQRRKSEAQHAVANDLVSEGAGGGAGGGAAGSAAGLEGGGIPDGVAFGMPRDMQRRKNEAQHEDARDLVSEGAGGGTGGGTAGLEPGLGLEACSIACTLAERVAEGATFDFQPKSGPRPNISDVARWYAERCGGVRVFALEAIVPRTYLDEAYLRTACLRLAMEGAAAHDVAQGGVTEAVVARNFLAGIQSLMVKLGVQLRQAGARPCR